MSKQVILCGSEAQRESVAALFPTLTCVYTNGATNWADYEGKRVVCVGIELAHMAQGYAAECKWMPEPPADLTPADAMGWAKANAVNYHTNPVPPVAARDSSSPVAGNAEALPNPPPADAAPVGAGPHNEAPQTVVPAVTGMEGESARTAPRSPTDDPYTALVSARSAEASPNATESRQSSAEPPPAFDPDEDEAQHQEPPMQPQPRSEGWTDPEGYTWPKPTDFWGSTHLPDLSEAWLPAAVAPFALDQAQLIGGDGAQMAVNIPSLCAAAIREQIGLQMQPENERWVERARLWGAVVGDASTKKGPMMDACTRHFFSKDIEIRKGNEGALEAYDLEAKRHQFAEATWIKESAKNAQAPKPVPPEKPLSERLWTDDATLQSLGKLLSHHARGKMTVMKDELSGWFGSFDQFTNAKDSDRAAYLSAYEGKSRYIDRSDGGRAFYVPSWSIGILGGIQPSVMARIAAKMGEDGMLARFMVIVAQESRAGDERRPDRAALIQWIKVIDNLLAMQPGPQPVRFDPDAQEFRKDVSAWVHKAMRSGMTSAMVAALGKYEGLFGRLALTYHCIEAAGNGLTVPPAEVSLDCAARAWGLMKNLLWPNMFHFYTTAMSGKENSDCLRLANFILARLHDTKSDVSAGKLSIAELSSWAHWRNMRAEDPSGRRIQNMLESMTNAGWIYPHMGSVSAVTRKFSKYQVSPILAERFADQVIYARAEREKWAALMPEKMPSKRRTLGED